MKSFEIAGYTVGSDSAPYVIAEMSGNHNKSLDRALAIVDAAADAGAHAVKLQTYTADTMTIDVREGEFFIDARNNPWKGSSLYELYQQAHTPWEWHEPIMQRCRERRVACFSTPFDASAVDFLERQNIPCYKIASFENVDLELVRRVARTGKPMIISTGMATVAELDETVRAVREEGCENLALLKCTSTYPASPENTNLSTIPHMRELFGCQVGLSDHTLGIGAAVASVAFGATVIEKHFTLSRAEGGVDAAFSLEPDELRALVVETGRAWQAVGQVTYGSTDPETSFARYRRSLYITEDLQIGDKLTEDNLRSIRPGLGLPPKYRPQLLGKRVNRNVRRGTPAAWDLVG